MAEAAFRTERIPLSQQVPVGLLLLVNHIQEHTAFYRVMLGKNGDQAFTYRFRQLSEQRYHYLFSRFNDIAPHNEMQFQFPLQSNLQSG